MTEYQVSVFGNDSNPGTEELPWLTIQKAANTLLPGDSVYVREGIYLEQVAPQNSGDVGNYITYQAYPGEVVIIDGQGVNSNGFSIADKSYLTFRGFQTKNHIHRGFYIARSDHIVISNSLITDWGFFGIEAELDCSYLDVYENEVIGSPSSIYSGIWFTATLNSKIHHNVVHECLGNGIGISLEANYNDIYNNLVYNNGLTPDNTMAGIGLEVNASYNNVYNNIVLFNRHAGILTNSQYNNFFNNTIFSSVAPNGYGGGFYFCNWSGSIASDNLVKNNIIIATGDDEKTIVAQEVECRNNIFDHNLHWHVSKPDTYDLIVWGPGIYPSFETWRTTYNQEPNGAYGDPLFVGGDMLNPMSYKLMEASPAIDLGETLTIVKDDYDGVPRPQGSGYDAGAYEGEEIGRKTLDEVNISNWQPTGSNVPIPQYQFDLEIKWTTQSGKKREHSGTYLYPNDIAGMPNTIRKRFAEEMIFMTVCVELGIKDWEDFL